MKPFIQNREQEIPKLTILQRFTLKVQGCLSIGEFSRDGWTGTIPHFIINCKEHGLQITYPCGWDGKLLCPECIKK